MPHTYTKEQVNFIRENYFGITTHELVKMINEAFEIELSYNQVRAYKKNNKLSSGIVTTFQPGQIPHSKGKPGTAGWKSTQFKTGTRPHNHMPVGTERVNTVGYVDIKIAEPNKWKQKHLILWESINGPVPTNHRIIFGDGNKLNINIENLIMVTRQQLFMMNKNNLIGRSAELTKVGVTVADLHQKIHDRSKKGRTSNERKKNKGSKCNK